MPQAVPTDPDAQGFCYLRGFLCEAVSVVQVTGLTEMHLHMKVV